MATLIQSHLEYKTSDRGCISNVVLVFSLQQCQSLKKENRRLQSAFLQNVFLQARVDTLQWQVKQVRNHRDSRGSAEEEATDNVANRFTSLRLLDIASRNNRSAHVRLLFLLDDPCDFHRFRFFSIRPLSSREWTWMRYTIYLPIAVNIKLVWIVTSSCRNNFTTLIYLLDWNNYY